jgi:CRISPR-associated endonuclease/helicase Cas3
VYGDEIEISDEALQKEMEEAIEKAEGKERADIFKAVQQLIYAPGDEGLLTQRNNNLDEDDPTVHKVFRAATRNAEPSISLICLHRINGAVCLDLEGSMPIDLSVKPDKEFVKQLLRQNINVQNRMVIDYFADNKPEFAWKETAALKYSIPVIFENGRFALEGKKYVLILDRQTGLTLQKEEQ